MLNVDNPQNYEVKMAATIIHPVFFVLIREIRKYL